METTQPTARMIGTETHGRRTYPVLAVPGPKPRLSNNGYNVFCGVPDMPVEGLTKSGWCILRFADGQEATLYASQSNRDPGLFMFH